MDSFLRKLYFKSTTPLDALEKINKAECGGLVITLDIMLNICQTINLKLDLYKCTDF